MAVAIAKSRVWAQLLRLPNLFTAVADPLTGWLLVNSGNGDNSGELAWLLGASACLYSAGMVLNDCWDYAEDCQYRPERPLPSGAVSRPVAWFVGIGLMTVGVVCAGLTGRGGLAIALVLSVLILLYNGLLKATFLGPFLLGSCRAFNLLLGMVKAPVPLLWAPLLLGVYVAGLSFFARREELQPGLRVIVKRLLLGIIVLDAMFLLVTGNWLGAGAVLMLLVPAWALSRILTMT